MHRTLRQLRENFPRIQYIPFSLPTFHRIQNAKCLTFPTTFALVLQRKINDQLGPIFPPLFKAEDRYSWSEYEQGLALGAYYWLHWTTQLPGGLWARKYGTKTVFGLGNLLPALLGFLIPLATRHNLYALIFLRALQGLVAVKRKNPRNYLNSSPNETKARRVFSLGQERAQQQSSRRILSCWHVSTGRGVAFDAQYDSQVDSTQREE